MTVGYLACTGLGIGLGYYWCARRVARAMKGQIVAWRDHPSDDALCVAEAVMVAVVGEPVAGWLDRHVDAR